MREKNLELIQERSEQLKPLNAWHATWCRLETKLTQPALARYRELFPAEGEKLSKETWSYTWKARKTTCEVSAFESSPLTTNHQGFLEAALCTLLQVHWVNSPFEGLVIGPGDVVNDGDRVHIRASSDPELGIYLDPAQVEVETRTKSHGALKALYSPVEKEWLPSRLEQRSAKATIVVDGIEYEARRLGGRRMIKSLWISVGEEKVLPHTEVQFSHCQNY